MRDPVLAVSRPNREPRRALRVIRSMSPPSPDRLDDAALIRRSGQEPEAFAALYDRHAAPIYRFAARRLGPDAAEDILAETFLAAFRRRETYDLTRADARPWLYGI